MRAWFFCVLLALGLGGCTKHAREEEAPKPAAHTTPVEAPVLSIIGARAASRLITQTVEAPGTIAADRTANLGSDVSGRVEEVLVDMGDAVVAGQVLARLSTRDAELQAHVSQAQLAESLAKAGQRADGQLLKPTDVPSVRKAKAGLDNAQKAYADYQALRKEDLISRRSLQEKRADYLQAKADYETALEQVYQARVAIGTNRATLAQDQSKIGEAVLRAPFDGFIQQKGIERGDYLAAGSASGLTVLSRNPMFVMLDVPQHLVTKIVPGRSLSFRVHAFPHRRMLAVVERIAPSLDPTSRALPVKARVAGAPDWLRPGMAVQAELATSASRRDVLVPTLAVLTQKGQSQIFVIERGVARAINVTTGERISGWVVVSPVKAGQEVAASDLIGMQTGAHVKVTRWERAPKLEGP